MKRTAGTVFQNWRGMSPLHIGMSLAEHSEAGPLHMFNVEAFASGLRCVWKKGEAGKKVLLEGQGKKNCKSDCGPQGC